MGVCDGGGHVGFLKDEELILAGLVRGVEVHVEPGPSNRCPTNVTITV